MASKLQIILLFGLIFNQSLCMESQSAQVSIRQSRLNKDSLEMHVSTQERNLKINLHPADNIWAKNAKIISLDSNGARVETSVKSLSDQGSIYTNAEKGTFVRVKDGKVEGILDGETSIQFQTDNNEHLVFRTEYPNENTTVTDALPLPFPSEDLTEYAPSDKAIRASLKNMETRQDQSGLYTVESLIVVDNALAQRFNNDISAIYNYLTIFWNGVQQRFDSINRTPAIKVKINAVKITSLGEESIFKRRTSLQYVEYSNTLNEFGNWLFRERANRNIPAYDFAYLQTGEELATAGNNRNIAGVAWVGGVCISQQNRFYGTSLGEDNGQFRGTHTAAHELGHILGAPHDPTSGTASCLWSLGYIMSYQTVNFRRLLFSPCSINSMYNTLPRRSCVSVTNLPVNPTCLGTIDETPGEALTGNEFCAGVTGNPAATLYDRGNGEICYKLRCLLGRYIYSYYRAIVGLSCRLSGGGMGQCLNGICQ